MRFSQKGDVAESLHRGHVAVADWRGRLLFSAGDPSFRTFARSVLKPFQLVGVIESGAADHFSFSNKELAVMAGSHSGSAAHLEVVQGILSKIGLGEEALECGAHPIRDPEQSRLISEGKRHLCQLHNNCSGKNSGMLSIAVKNGWDHVNYQSLNHKVQQYVLGRVREILDLPALDEVHFAIDGCGVPTPHLEIRTLATGFARLAVSGAVGAGGVGGVGGVGGTAGVGGEYHAAAGFPFARELARVSAAMVEHPEMVAGEGRVCTAIIRSGRGRLLAKGGGEGIYCLGDRETGLGVCLKIEDGTPRAVAPAAVECIRQLGLLDDTGLNELMEFSTTPVTNHRGTVVGAVRPCFELEKCD